VVAQYRGRGLSFAEPDCISLQRLPCQNWILWIDIFENKSTIVIHRTVGYLTEIRVAFQRTLSCPSGYVIAWDVKMEVEPKPDQIFRTDAPRHSTVDLLKA
jgi:hypothetical protein